MPALSGPEHPYWKGGRIRTNNGYVYVKVHRHPRATIFGYVLEHRLVMEKELGRFLESGEVVHHINGIHDDNRPENLRLFENTSRHSAFHFANRPVEEFSAGAGI